jgi:DNA repair protein RadC
MSRDKIKDKVKESLNDISVSEQKQQNDDIEALIEAISRHNKNQQFLGQNNIKNFDNSTNDLNTGHRSRLKTRFLNSPRRALPDYEILEMILFYTIVRKDTKPIAKILLKKFGSLAGIVFADDASLKTIAGVGEGVIFFIKLLADFFSRLCVPQQKGEVHVLSSWLAVLNYCQLTMGFKKSESFRVLMLNKKNVLIADEFIDAGTVDKIAIYPREISKMTLLHGAAAIILVHNHPSGDPNPSREDIEITNKIIEALLPISVAMHDHVIVAEHNHFSFRAAGLI